MSKPNGYILSRNWFNFSFEKKEAKVQHTALYMWVVELNNRLGWKEEFQLPTIDTMEGLSIGNKNTYISTLNDLVEWKFIQIVKASKNQYQATVIKLCYDKSATALVTALDTALQQHSTQHSDSIGDGIDTGSDPIDKQVNNETEKPNKPKTNKRSSSSADEVNTNDYLKVYNDFLEKKIGASEHFSVAGRTALKKIRQYLEAQVKIKHPRMEGEELESQTLAAFNYLFVNFDKWDNFHKGQIKLQQIESNLLNIINSIKNGNPKDKRPADPFKMATEAIALSRAAAKERASRDSQMPQD